METEAKKNLPQFAQLDLVLLESDTNILLWHSFLKHGIAFW